MQRHIPRVGPYARLLSGALFVSALSVGLVAPAGPGVDVLDGGDANNVVIQ